MVKERKWKKNDEIIGKKEEGRKKGKRERRKKGKAESARKENGKRR